MLTNKLHQIHVQSLYDYKSKDYIEYLMYIINNFGVNICQLSNFKLQENNLRKWLTGAWRATQLLVALLTRPVVNLSQVSRR